MAAPTIYGQRYGVQEGSPWGPGKSGLTPLSPLNPLMAPITLDRMLSVEDYQSFLLNGLTTQLLRDLDCITERDLKPNDLKNPIFKTWQKHHWDTEENFKDQHTFELYDMSLEVLRLIGQEGQTVKWVAGHPKVWEALEPCLRLGTRILDGLCDHPWFDAVLLAKRENISPQRFSSEARKAAYEKTNPGANIIDVLQTKYKCFNLRTLEERGDGSECRRKFKQVIDEVFNSSYGKLSIGLMSDQIDPLEGRNLNSDPSIPRSTLGLTAVIPTIRDIKVWLAYQEVAPLLRNDLSSSERLMDTWNVAVNMVHETIHAFNKANWLLGPRYQGDEHENRMRESYFGVEQEIELGRSGEQAIYGDIVEGLIKGEKRSETAPHLGFSIGIFPEPTNFHGIAGNPRLINPNASAIGLALPLPVTYYENINSEEYWEIYVKKFSINGALKPPKLVDGVYQKRDPETGVFEWLAITEKDVGVRQTID